MAIERTGARLTIAEQLSRNPAFRNRPLALELKDAVSGRILRAAAVVAAGAQGIGNEIAAAASRALEIIRPEMITSERLSFNVMKDYVTVAMFRQFVLDTGYKIEGHNSDKLIALLADTGKRDQVLNHVSYNDAVAYVTWYNEKTGENKRIPTEAEWLVAQKEVGNQLARGLWEWTSTIGSGVARVLRHAVYGSRSGHYPGVRYSYFALRFVEDKK